MAKSIGEQLCTEEAVSFIILFPHNQVNYRHLITLSVVDMSYLLLTPPYRLSCDPVSYWNECCVNVINSDPWKVHLFPPELYKVHHPTSQVQEFPLVKDSGVSSLQEALVIEILCDEVWSAPVSGGQGFGFEVNLSQASHWDHILSFVKYLNKIQRILYAYFTAIVWGSFNYGGIIRLGFYHTHTSFQT